MILAHHANVNAGDKDGRTHLWNDVNAKDVDGRTPLSVAAQLGRTGVAELLLAHGADVNAKDNKGGTAVEGGRVRLPGCR